MHAYDLADRLGRVPQLQRLAGTVERVLPEGLWAGRAGHVLRGHWLGHALHPSMTDFPLGMWTASTILDVLGSRHRRASMLLNGAGIAAVVPTALSGLAEWDAVPQDQRGVAALHATVNGVAGIGYLVSFVAKVRRRPRAAAIAAVTGALVATLGGYLGGHLAIGRGVGSGARR